MSGADALFTSINNKVRAETESPLAATLLPSLKQYAAKAVVFYEEQ